MNWAAREYLTASVAETEQLASDLAAKLEAGDVIALIGDLGAGKTQFVRGLLRGVNGDPRQVSSPTFVLLHIYDGGRLPIFHLDAYRVAGADDLDAIGFSELLEQGGLVVVEWADRVMSLLPERRWEVRIEPVGVDARQISVVSPLTMKRRPDL